ncbi:MAG: hypothetical protein KJZ83_16750 [Burkholderiaceae bacterium]|nr:hypothetical protein [Burkholderiaceae bacterium]
MSTIHLPSFAPATSRPAAPAAGRLIRTRINGFLAAIVRVAARAQASRGALLPGGDTVSQSRDRHVELYTQAERVMSIL